MSTAALIVAAGRGTRAGGGIPKQWRQLAGKSVIEHTMSVFHLHPRIDHLVLVLHPDDIDNTMVPPSPPSDVVAGGATRSASVLAGLQALQGRCDRVLIHDAARPCVSAGVIDQVLNALETSPGAAPAIPVVDALWSGENAAVTGTVDRTGLYRAQTPQGFLFEAIFAAHQRAAPDAPDDVAVARAAGLSVVIVPGDEQNLKITQPEDFDRAERILRNTMNTNLTDIRLGNGYDVHRFGPGDHVVLCGVTVPFERGLLGHSDADVGMHAVTDAIYGALAQGDIGQHFPPTDPQWKGAASDIFLRHAVDLAKQSGFHISNVDCTLICEFPKIGPHAAQMRAVMANIMGLEENRVSVKATTSEKLGFTGRGEGIAAMATATLVSP